MTWLCSVLDASKESGPDPEDTGVGFTKTWVCSAHPGGHLSLMETGLQTQSWPAGCRGRSAGLDPSWRDHQTYWEGTQGSQTAVTQ